MIMKTQRGVDEKIVCVPFSFWKKATAITADHKEDLKMEKKKLASFLLAGTMALSLTACGSGGSGSAAASGSASGSASASASGSSGSGTITIGTISPNTGSLATYGTAVTTAVDLAVSQINDAGGINGSQVKVINADDQFDPTECLNAFNSLVAQGVGLIVGSVTSGCTSAITDAADEEGVCLLTPSSTADSITTKDDYVFRACYADGFQGAIAAAYASQSGHTHGAFPSAGQRDFCHHTGAP